MQNINLRKISSPRFYLPGILIISLIFLPFVLTNPGYMQVVIILMFYGYLTICWNLVGGFAGVLPLGNAAFIGIGAYTSSLLYITFGVSPWIGMLVGGFLSMIVGILIGYPTLKLKGAYFALATIAFGEAMRIMVGNIDQIWKFKINAMSGIQIPLENESFALFQFIGKTPYYFIMLIMLFCVLLITKLISDSKIGYYLRAGGEDQVAAESLGVNVAHYKLFAMALCSFLTALAGTFYAQLTLYFYPKGIMDLNLSFEIAFIAIIGGRGTIAGPIIGALILRPISEFTRMYLGGSFPGIHLVLYGVILIAVMIWQPRGLQEIFSRYYNRLLDRLEPSKR